MSGNLRWIALETAIARHRADAEPIGGAIPDPGQFAQPIDVDQQSRLGQPEIHRRYKALTAGQEARLVAVFGFQRQGLLDGLGGDVTKGRGLHSVQSGPLKLAMLAGRV
jgi:hypothetical protein